MLIINPGSGPVADATREQAAESIRQFVEDVAGADATKVTIEDTGDERLGRFTFVLRVGNRESVIDMPGLATEQVRYLGAPDQNIWDFPRLYENGSSWVWCYAVSQAAHSLFGEDEDEDE